MSLFFWSHGRRSILSFPSVKIGESSSENAVPQNDVAKTDETEEKLKERSSRKSRKKEKESVAEGKPSIKSRKEKKLLVFPLEASVISIFLLVLFGAFYVGVLDDKYDDLPEQSFYMAGGIEKVIAKAEKIAKESAA